MFTFGFISGFVTVIVIRIVKLRLVTKNEKTWRSDLWN